MEEQVAKAVEGAHPFGDVSTTVDIVETIATENVSRVDRAMRGGADLSEDNREAVYDEPLDEGKVTDSG